jgi:hypothetical protein
LQFENLVLWCEAAERWEFLVVASPLRIEGGTGSPVNAIAILCHMFIGRDVRAVAGHVEAERPAHTSG